MTDDTYIRMILVLPDEFFKDWKWQVGDRAITLNHKNREAMVVAFNVWSDPKIIHVLFFGMEGYTYLQSLEFLRPLPSQRQLQDMLIDPKNPIDLEVWKLLEEFQKFVSAELIRHHERGVYLENSFDVFWLKFVMFYKYKMLWKREAWVKIEENLSSGIGVY